MMELGEAFHRGDEDLERGIHLRDEGKAVELQMKSVDSENNSNMADLSIPVMNVLEGKGGFTGVNLDATGGEVVTESNLGMINDTFCKEDQKLAACISGAVTVDELANSAMEVDTLIDTNENRVTRVLDPQGGVYEHTVGTTNTISLVVDLSSCIGEGGDSKAGNISKEGIEFNEFPGDGSLPFSGGLADSAVCGTNGTTLNEIKDVVNDVEKENVRPNASRNDHYGNVVRTEKEGEFYAPDLVWGKVRSHPWWPGQIFDSSDSSENAMKHYKKDSFLIAYFGDQSFAWNEALRIKPFRKHFSRMEKQSSLEAFCHAVDCALEEISRRVELGLACPCLPEEVHAKIKSQIIVNAGVREESSRRDGGDEFSSVDSFRPLNLVQKLKALAESPYGGTDRLESLTLRAQLLAFNRWKGYNQIPNSDMLDVLDSDLAVEDAVLSSEDDGQVFLRTEKSLSDDISSRKRSSSVNRGKKVKRVSDLMFRRHSSLPIHVNESERKSVRKSVQSSSGKKRKVGDSVIDDLGAKRRKSMSSSGAKNPLLRINETVPSVANQLEKVASENEMLSQLRLVATDPMKGYSFLIAITSFLSDFRNSFCLENSNSWKRKKSTGKESGEETEKKPCKSETTETSEFEGMEDSYWTDRIVQSYPEEQVLFEPVTQNGKSTTIVEPEAMGSQEYSPTALILNFTDLDSVPSETNLNMIFSRYGSLNELETEVLRKSKRAKVVFKRRSDAETAFSSAGKFSIFGPSLVSYRLNYSPTPRKGRASETKRRTS